MCGIGGMFTIGESDRNDYSFLYSMHKSLHHRGRDQNGIVILPDKGFGLVHLRLSVLDLSDAGRQPMWNMSNTIAITFNGEIYNFKEVRMELEKKGVQFFSNTDTEVILKGYECFGIDILQKINGMFAFAIVDCQKRTLLLARDRIGEKPLYYWKNPDNDSIVFSSEIKALLDCKLIKRTINPDALNNYLAFGYIPGDQSIFNNIKKLLPGHYIFVNHEGMEQKEYWNVKNNKTDLNSRTEYCEHIKNQVERIVIDRMISDIPIGTFLSGGVDSSIITGIMSENTTTPVRTFSAAFDVGSRSFKYNTDADIAEIVSKRFKTDHSRMTIKTDNNFLDVLKKVMWHIDEPNSNPTLLTTYLLSEYVKQHGVSVILSGDGSDEIFGGYHRYLSDRLVSQTRYIPQVLRNTLLNVITKNSRFALCKKVLDKAAFSSHSSQRYLSWWEVFPHEQRKCILSKQMQSGICGPNEVVQKVISSAPKLDDQNMLGYLDLKLWIPEESNCRVDKMSMAHTLEVRAPFEDYKLVELMFNIPFSKKVTLNKGKILLKNSFRDILPKEVLNGPKKGWFSPSYYWMRDHLAGDVKRMIAILQTTELFANDQLKKFETLPIEKTMQLWNLFTFSLWHQIYMQSDISFIKQ